MKIRPIKNNRDYQEALREIDRLMDAQPNTAQGDRLDVLVTLVVAWEEKHCHQLAGSGRGDSVCDGAVVCLT